MCRLGVCVCLCLCGLVLDRKSNPQKILESVSPGSLSRPGSEGEKDRRRGELESVHDQELGNGDGRQ